MHINDIEKIMDYLFSVALKKCGNFEDAEDLTSETLLAANLLVSPAKGKFLANCCVFPKETYIKTKVYANQIFHDSGYAEKIIEKLIMLKDNTTAFGFYGINFDYDYLIWILCVAASNCFGKASKEHYLEKYKGKFADRVSEGVEKMLFPYVRKDLMSNFIHRDMQMFFQLTGALFYHCWNDYLAKPDDYSTSAAGLYIAPPNKPCRQYSPQSQNLCVANLDIRQYAFDLRLDILPFRLRLLASFNWWSNTYRIISAHGRISAVRFTFPSVSDMI
ncbi:MAG: hypothetical protein ACI4JW_07830 [Oscillospiraceae bacterium]